MEIRLEPDVAARVDELAAQGADATPAALVNQALRLFLDKPELRRRHEELKRLIQEGIESGEREGWLDGEEVFDEIVTLQK